MGSYSFLAEDVTRSTFGRFNFQGCVLTQSLSVPGFPHQLRTNIVTVINLNSQTEGKIVVDLRIRVVRDGTPPPEWYQYPLYDELPVAIDQIVITNPIELELAGTGRLEFRASAEGIVHEAAWPIKIGAAPLRGRDAPSTTSQIVTSETELVDVKAIAASATEELRIVDAYLPPDVLEKIVANVGEKVRIRVLVPERGAAKYEVALHRLREVKPRIECHVDCSPGGRGRFHDRFVCINSNEIFCFGTSLKDVLSGRVTRVAKLYDVEEIESFIKKFEEAWGVGRAL